MGQLGLEQLKNELPSVELMTFKISGDEFSILGHCPAGDVGLDVSPCISLLLHKICKSIKVYLNPGALVHLLGHQKLQFVLTNRLKTIPKTDGHPSF